MLTLELTLYFFKYICCYTKDRIIETPVNLEKCLITFLYCFLFPRDGAVGHLILNKRARKTKPRPLCEKVAQRQSVKKYQSTRGSLVIQTRPSNLIRMSTMKVVCGNFWMWKCRNKMAPFLNSRRGRIAFLLSLIVALFDLPEMECDYIAFCLIF